MLRGPHGQIQRETPARAAGRPAQIIPLHIREWPGGLRSLFIPVKHNGRDALLSLDTACNRSFLQVPEGAPDNKNGGTVLLAGKAVALPGSGGHLSRMGNENGKPVLGVVGADFMWR